MSSPIIETQAAPMADFSSLMDLAKAAFKGGRFDEASRAYARILDEHGDNPAAWFILGATAWKSGETGRAIEAFQNAVSRHRSNVDYRLMLARVHRESDRLDDAVDVLKDALELAPWSFEVRMALGTAQIAAGQKEEGVANCGKGFRLVVARMARDAGGLVPLIAISVAAAARVVRDRACGFAVARRFEQARWLARKGEFERAVQVCKEATAGAPEYARGVALLGHLFACAGDDIGALECCEAAVRLDPDDDRLRVRLSQALSAVSRHDDALDMIDPLMGRKPFSAEAVCAKGKALYGTGRAAEARTEFERVLAREPRNVIALYGLARCYMELGAFEDASLWLDKLLDIRPSHASAYRDLAGSRQLDVDGAHLKRAKSLLDDTNLMVNQRVILHFAVAAAEDAAGHVDEAFHHCRIGNTLKNVIHSQPAHADRIDRLCASFDADFFRRTEGWGTDSERPIFILGMPRSGTTLIEQILASHPRVFGAGELNDMFLTAARLPQSLGTDEPFPQCIHLLTSEVVRDLAARYLDKLDRLSGGADRVSDKMPGNFLSIGLIATLFPNARIIHCRREAQDTCLSIYFQNFEGHHSYAYDLSNLGHYYRQYEHLMDHWRRVVPTPILDMPYEDVVADQEGMTRRLLEFCDLDWNDRCLAFHQNERSVHTSSFAQVRKPIYKSSLARHKRYQQHLGPLRQALGLAGA